MWIYWRRQGRREGGRNGEAIHLLPAFLATARGVKSEGRFSPYVVLLQRQRQRFFFPRASHDRARRFCSKFGRRAIPPRSKQSLFRNLKRRRTEEGGGGRQKRSIPRISPFSGEIPSIPVSPVFFPPFHCHPSFLLNPSRRRGRKVTFLFPRRWREAACSLRERRESGMR